MHAAKGIEGVEELSGSGDPDEEEWPSNYCIESRVLDSCVTGRVHAGIYPPLQTHCSLRNMLSVVRARSSTFTPRPGE